MPEVFLCAEKVRSAAIVFYLYLFPNWRAALGVKEGLQPIGFDAYQARASQTGDRSLWILIWTLSVVPRADVYGTERWRRTRCGSAPRDRHGSSRSSRGQSLRIYLPRFPHSHPTDSPVLSALPSPTAPSTGLSILKSPSMNLLFS